MKPQEGDFGDVLQINLLSIRKEFLYTSICELSDFRGVKMFASVSVFIIEMPKTPSMKVAESPSSQIPKLQTFKVANRIQLERPISENLRFPSS